MKSLKISDKRKLYLDLMFASVLLLYSLRHIRYGLDLWDTGYNYANFTYIGMEHMDSMWLFSTYLATAVGHFLTLLPGAGGLLGMNFYTSLFAGGLAVGGYFFCTRKLGMQRWIAFAGELAALCLCWSPTAVLYNYLTYVLFLGCVVLLYKGLTEDKMCCLFVAGVCLGCNVLVRFSNLPEMGMIAAVWAWDFILWRERKKAGEGKMSFWRTLIRHTLWCVAGYLAALAVLFGYIHIRYGMGSYVAGIKRLFAMTEDAPDYKAKAMLMKLFGTYVVNLYWVLRIGIIILAGMIGFAVLGFIRRRTCGMQADSAGSKIWAVVWRLAQAGWCGVGVLMLAWLYYNKIYSFDFYTYNAILQLSILFMMLTMLIGVIRIFHPGSRKEEKLISGIVVLVVLLTSIGSNNGVFPSVNNLFVAAPYTLWECRRFVGMRAERAFSAKVVLTAFLALYLFQTAAFGCCFVFEESVSAKDETCVIENNEILQGIKMNPERARWLSGLSAYVEEQGLQGREVILYGWIPSLSYYLQMPSAFNPWSDLASYSVETMAADLKETETAMESGDGERSVIIIENEYALYLEGGGPALQEAGAAESQIAKIRLQEEKNVLLRDYMEKYNYDLTYKNEKFWVYE